MNDERLANCGCCEGVSRETPLAEDNRPGQSRIAYRVGTHARFKESMLAALSGQAPLQGLKTRDDNDASIALLDGAATVLDVLSFYNERIANEGYLRTATERRSVLELAREIGYELNPGVAASTFLAFSMETAVGAPADAKIPIGTKAQSIPGQGQKPQTFETIAEVEARPAWNALRPRLTAPAPFGKGDTSLYLAGTDWNLKAGDVLVFVGGDRKTDPQSDLYDVCRVTAIDVQPKAARTLLSWAPALKNGPLAQGEVYVMRTRAALFGYNAPKWSALPVALRIGEISPQDNKFVAGIYSGRSGTWADAKFSKTRASVDLDSVYDGLAAGEGSWLVLARAAPNRRVRLYDVKSVAETNVADFNLAAKVTRLGIAGRAIEEFSPRNAAAYAKSERLIPAEAPITTALPHNDWLLATNVEGLKKGQWIAITEQHYDDAGKPVGPAVSEVAQIDTVSEQSGLTKLRFDRDLTHDYAREWTTLNANVAPATHGETRKEVLGSGDASKPLQQFVLKQRPLTCIASSAASGATGTLAIRVNDVLWHEQPRLYGEPPDESLFVTRIDNDGSARVTFGDGERGRRLPTGVENVEATYRVGTGQDGMVKARQISLLATRPLGVRDVVNPTAPEGAEDPEKLDDARDNAPLTVLTLDRIVSLSDFEDYARAFGGIAKARAAWLWDKESRIVHLTLAAPLGNPVDPLGKTARDLRASIDAHRHSRIQLRFSSYTELKFAVDAGLRIDADHDKDKVRAAVKQTLIDTFSFARQQFAAALPASRVIAVIQAVAGVVAVDLNYLYVLGQPVLLNALLQARVARWVGTMIAPAELIVIAPDAITLGEMQS